MYFQEDSLFFYLGKKFQKITTKIEIVGDFPNPFCPQKGLWSFSD